MDNREFQTDRLIIHPLHKSDLNLVIQMNTDPVVMKYLEPVQTVDEVIKDMPRLLELGSGAPFKGGIWVMTEKASNISFGTLFLVDMPISGPEIVPVKYTGDMQIGYRSIPSHWGQGYTTEGAKALIDLTFANSDLDKLVACTDDGNEASQNVLRKIGLSYMDSRWVYGGKSPYFEITRSDWLREKENK